jgi:hypothetical protein
VAVADGLGSVSNSERGARLAVEAAVKFVSQRIQEPGHDPVQNLAVGAIAAARAALEDDAGDNGHDLRSLACTLIVAVFVGGRLSVAQVGDGGAVAQVGDQFQLVTRLSDSEYLNEVIPLTSAAWRTDLRYGTRLTEVRGVALFSDGMIHAVFRPEHGVLLPFAGFLEPVFRYARGLDVPDKGSEALAQLLASKKLGEHCDDDKTLALAVLS